MELIIFLFGEDQHLNSLQMAVRAICIFFITLFLIRISGRRSFSLHTPLDSIVAILLGSILSRPAVGASPFIPTIVGCLVLSILHRLIARGAFYSKAVENFIKGKKLLLFQDGVFFEENLKRSLLTKEDFGEQIRIHAQKNSLEDIQEVFMERNGKISIILKNHSIK